MYLIFQDSNINKYIANNKDDLLYNTHADSLICVWPNHPSLGHLKQYFTLHRIWVSPAKIPLNAAMNLLIGRCQDSLIDNHRPKIKCMLFTTADPLWIIHII